MMNENVDKTASSMAMVEKKPQRLTGGCAGIFFQLFNWNKSFSKKKLFSKKLLPPAHPQQCSRKFGGDEKFPKNRLIANENSGGFPNMKKNGGCNNATKQKPQMRSPSLVARLMGLESMPAVQKIKSSKETSVLHTSVDEEKIFTNTQNDFDPNLVKHNVQNELRPPKLQKTEQSERQALTKFTSEAFQFKSVLSQSKKHHRSKLVSPLKSPKMISSGKSSTRLFDVATRFLEPGLQNTKRAKSAVTYPSNVQKYIENRNDFVMERKVGTPGIPKSFDCQLSLKTHSCKHCGNEIGLNLEEKILPFSSSHPDYSNADIEETKRNPNGPPLSSFEQEKWRVSDRYNELSTPSTSQAKNNKKPFIGEGQSRQCKPPRDLQPCIGPNQKPHRQSQLSSNRSKRASFASNCVNHSKDFGTKTAMKINNNVTRNEENSSCNKRVSSLSPVKRSRSFSGTQNSENSIQKNTRCNLVGDRVIRLDSRSSNSTNHGRGCYVDKHKTNYEKSSAFDPNADSSESHVKKNGVKLLALSGDELGAILQEKLRELSGQEDDDMAIGGREPKRTTSVILQELISALTMEKKMVYNNEDVEPQDKVLCHSPHLSNKMFTFEAKQKMTVRPSSGYVHEGEYLSPGSVLEASFSNDSCLSSNFGDGSAPNFLADSAEVYFDGLPKHEPEAGLFDSSASLGKGCKNINMLIDLISHVFEVLLSLGFANKGLKRSKLAYAKDIILNTELVSGNASQSISLSHFLIYELENLARAMWTDFEDLIGFKDKKHENSRTEFVIDCVIEYLDTRFGRYSSCGFVTWTKMPICSSSGELVVELVNEVKWWMCFNEYSLDEIINFEMSHSYGKWADFEIEMYETGAEIGTDVLQILVDEIVVDLFQGKKCSEQI